MVFVAAELLRADFWNLPGDAQEQSCRVIYGVGCGAETNVAPPTVAREMMCVRHTIRHSAILEVLCAAHEGLKVPQCFFRGPTAFLTQTKPSVTT
ncbi:MAG TPA: hypothetical protein VNO52_05895 [Methylomirabilota bacterium]|nr:hypothetical protein [Methylomirabilota bacterium]